MTIRDIAIAFGYEVDERSEKQVNESIDKLKSIATTALGAIGIGFSLVNANEIITEFGKINAQIQNATKDLSDQKAVQEQIVTAANAARTSYADIANLTSKLVQQNRDLFDVESAARYAELTTKLFKSENKEQGDILALQDAINVSFAKGAVEAETVGQIIEQSPAAADLLARHIGAARSELEQMASDGKISLEQLRDAFLGNADEIEAAFANVDLTISDALLNIRNQWGLWLAQMDKTLGVTKTIAKIMTRTFTQFMNILRKAQTYTERFVKKIGGAENALKLLAMAVGAIFIALNAGKILDFLKAVKGAVTGINLKTVALVAAIMLILLAVDDFINFMKGNDSVIGVILEKWGIDADAVRKKITEAWDGIKTVLQRTLSAIKDIFKGLLQFLSGVFTGDWDKAFSGLKAIVGSTFKYIEDVFGKFAPVVKAVAVAFAAWKTVQTFSNLAKGTVTIVKQTAALVANTVGTVANTVAKTASTAAQKAWNIAAKAGTAVTKGLGAAFKFLTSPMGLVVVAIAALVGIIAMLIKNGGDVDGLIQQITGGLNKFTGIVEKVVSGIAEKLPQIVDAIVNVITKVLNVIVEKLPLFIDMGINLIMSLLGGIMKMLPKIIDAVIKLVMALVQAIVALLPKLIDAGIKLIMSLISGIVSMLPQIITAIITLVTSLITAIVDMLPQLIDAGIQLIMSLIEGIVSALPGIIKAVVGLIPTLLNAIISNLPKLIKAGIQIIISLITGIVKAVPQIIKAVVDVIPVIVKSLIDNLPLLIQAGIEIIIALASGLIQAIPELIKAIPQIIGAILDGFGAIFGGLGDIIGGFVGLFKNAFKTTANFFRGIWNGIASFFKSLWDGMIGTVNGFVDLFKNAFTAVSDFFKGIWESLSGFFSGIWDGIKSVFSTVADFFTGIFTQAADGIKSAFSGIKDFFSNLFQTVANVVKAPINTIIGGINNFIGGLNKIKIPDWVPGVGGKGISLPTLPQLAKGGVLKKGQTGYLEGNGAEAVVPLEKNTEWISKVAAMFKKNISGGSDNGTNEKSDTANGILDAVKSIGGVVGNAVKAVAEKSADKETNSDTNALDVIKSIGGAVKTVADKVNSGNSDGSTGLGDALKSFVSSVSTLAQNATASPATARSMVTSTTNRSITQNNYFESTFNGDRAGQQRSSEAMNKSANDATGQLARALAYSR